MFTDRERRYVETARVGRLATADAEARPHAVPVCFAFAGNRIATPVDEKPKEAASRRLRRCRDVAENPRAALVVDRYTEDWSRLGWVQVRGTATLLDPGESGHAAAVDALEAKYDQYADHDLGARPVVELAPGSVRSWGDLENVDARPSEGE